uniref:Apple domain-containing protein n=1 Tax=Eutreptiella gymnastica TaxID=73025 RepID=A0A7S1I920_9EUGL
MTSGNVVPAGLASDAIGGYYFTLDEFSGDFDFTIVASGLSGPVTSVSLHCDMHNSGTNCRPGSSCPVCAELAGIHGNVGSGIALPLKGTVTLGGGIVHRVRTGNAYIQVSTTARPMGEIRGYGISATCPVVLLNTTYSAPDVAVMTASSPNECCTMCQQHTRCLHWTWAENQTKCHMKETMGTVTPQNDDDYVSGDTGPKQYRDVSVYGLPTHTAVLTSPQSVFQAAMVFFSEVGNLNSVRQELIHTAYVNATYPAKLIKFSSSVAAVTSNPSLANTGTTRDIPGNKDVFYFVQSPQDKEALGNVFTGYTIDYTGYIANTWNIHGWVHDVDISPIAGVLPAPGMDAAVFPSVPGVDDGKVTLSIRLSGTNAGNEVWVTLPEGFGLEKFSGLQYFEGADPPQDVVANPKTREVQLRWNATIPYNNPYGPILKFVVAGVTLPNSCEAKPYHVKTMQCGLTDFMGAGVLMHRTCTTPTNQFELTTKVNSNGFPTRCKANGCNSCKYLYTSPADNLGIFECHHQGETYHRSWNTQDCTVCPYGVAHETNTHS